MGARGASQLADASLHLRRRSGLPAGACRLLLLLRIHSMKLADNVPRGGEELGLRVVEVAWCSTKLRSAPLPLHPAGAALHT